MKIFNFSALVELDSERQSVVILLYLSLAKVQVQYVKIGTENRAWQDLKRSFSPSSSPKARSSVSNCL